MRIYIYETPFELHPDEGELISQRPPTPRFWEEWNCRKQGMRGEGWRVTRYNNDWEASISLSKFHALPEFGNELYEVTPEDTADDRQIKADLLIDLIKWDHISQDGTCPLNLTMKPLLKALTSHGFTVSDGQVQIPTDWTVEPDAIWDVLIPYPPNAR